MLDLRSQIYDDSHHEYFTLHQKNQIKNILQSLISSSLLLAPCIVRTFEKSLTAVDIIKFTEEDEMEYLIIKHSVAITLDLTFMRATSALPQLVLCKTKKNLL